MINVRQHSFYQYFQQFASQSVKMGDRVYFLTSASASRDFSAPTVTNVSCRQLLNENSDDISYFRNTCLKYSYFHKKLFGFPKIFVPVYIVKMPLSSVAQINQAIKTNILKKKSIKQI